MSARHIGERLKAERLKRGWTQEQVIEELGYDHRVTGASITKIENLASNQDLRLPSLRIILLLTDLYGLELTFKEKDGKDE